MSNSLNGAVSSLSEILRYPDDLSKIPAVRERLSREKAAIDLQLKSTVQTQLDITTNGLKNLLDSRSIVEALTDELDQLNSLCAEAETIVPGFSQANRVFKIKRNFVAVEDVMQRLKELPEMLDKIEALIDQDGKDIFGPMPNLLRIHFELARLRDFRDSAMSQASRAGNDAVRTLSQYFSRLDENIKQFDDILSDIGQNLLEVLREGNTSLVVRWAKIIDLEEKLDKKAKNFRTVSIESREASLTISSISQNSLVTRSLRNYDEKITDCIRLAASDVFRNCISTFPDDPETLLDNLYWVFRDILLAKTGLQPCVPSQWKIVDRFVAMYHQEMYILVKSLINKDTDAGTLLKVVRWSQKYEDTMTKDLKIPKSQLAPPLLDGQEDELLSEYMNLICRKINEWMSTLAKTEYQEFIDRDKAPDVDPDSKYGLSSTPIVFQMLNQQINVAIDSDEIKVVAGVIRECKRQLIERQRKWAKVVHDEVQQSNVSPDNVAGGLVEYCIAIANDQVRGADYTDAIITRQVNTNVDILIHSDNHRAIQSEMVQELEDTMDGFIATAKICILEIIDMVMVDVQSTFASLFKSSWYNTNNLVPSTGGNDATLMSEGSSPLMQEVVRTFEEYNIELKAHLNYDLFQIYIDDLLDATLVNYLSALSKNKGAYLTANAIDQIKSDVSVVYPFFSSFTDNDHVQIQFRGIEVLMGLISSDKIGVVEEFKVLKKSFPDAPLKLIEDILKARDDLDSKTVRDYVEAIRTQCSDLLSSQTSDRQTYMSKINA
ncbi:exocyst complex component Sec6-domain-containing protein [Dipodascopsis uninucleata]